MTNERDWHQNQMGPNDRYSQAEQPPSKEMIKVALVRALVIHNWSQPAAQDFVDLIEQLQCSADEPPVTPDPTGDWPLKVFKPLPPDEAKALREAVPEVFGDSTQPPCNDDDGRARPAQQDESGRCRMRRDDGRSYDE